MPVTNLNVRTARPGSHTDRHGLILIVLPSGSRHWKLRMQFKGRRRDDGLGPVHDVSLAEARILASEIRKMVRAGLDPVEIRGLKRKRPPTFEQVARKCYESLRGGWKDRRYASWLSSLENHIFPEIGNKRIDEIDAQLVLQALEPIWLEIPDTARRILQRIGTVLDYAHIKGHAGQAVSLKSVRRGLPPHVTAMSAWSALKCRPAIIRSEVHGCPSDDVHRIAQRRPTEYSEKQHSKE